MKYWRWLLRVLKKHPDDAADSLLNTTEVAYRNANEFARLRPATAKTDNQSHRLRPAIDLGNKQRDGETQ